MAVLDRAIQKNLVLGSISKVPMITTTETPVQCYGASDGKRRGGSPQGGTECLSALLR